MADPEDSERDEAERVDQHSGHDILDGRELLVSRSRDVRDRQAEPEDRHHGSKDAVRQRLDPGFPESCDRAASCAHEVCRAIVTAGYKSGLDRVTRVQPTSPGTTPQF